MKEWIEDYEVGETLTSHGRTIGEADFLAYAGIEHDFESIHFDAQLMEASEFGRRIGAGFIPLNLAVGLFGQGEWDWYWPKGAIRTEGWEDLKFTAPTFIGDTIRCRREIAAIEVSGDSGVLVQRVEVVNQDGRTVLTGRERIRVRATPPIDSIS